MEHENTRNTVVFFVCMAVILIAYQVFILNPQARRREAEAKLHPAAQQFAPGPSAPAYMARAQAVAASDPVPIDTPTLEGSVARKGGRIDDLFLKNYRETIAKSSPPVELFRPDGAKQAYFADLGWVGAAGMPGPDTVWTLSSGSTLAPGRPVGLTWDNGKGLVFTRTIAVDDQYMFTVTDAVANHGGAPVQLAPYASVQRQGLPVLSPALVVHEGGVGDLGGTLKLVAFKNWKKQGDTSAASTGGWLGLTDKYWLSAVVPDQKTPVTGQFRVDTVNSVDVYEADYTGPPRTLAPGAQTSSVTHVFAGAKKLSVLQAYQKSLGIPRFDDAVDWGHFWFLTRPIFWLMSVFHGWVGNWGVAILMLTLVLRLLVFPLANKSFESMSKMKKVQPEVEAIRKRYEKEPAKQQQETMALYQREHINPLMGCLPALIQIPIFFSLYKVLYVTLEMRHAAFFGWIQDLSAPDPTTFVNLFGLIPWNPATTPYIGGFLDGPLHIGVWPLLYGATMWLTQSMSPQATTDPTQKLIFQLMPIMFTFFFSHLAAALIIYYTCSNLFTGVQQYVMMHKYKVENPIDDLIRRLRSPPPAASG